MKVLLSTIGSRGEVQPVLALALELRALGHDTTVVVPPSFQEWLESFGLTVVPIGPDVRKLFSGRAPTAPPRLTKALARQRAGDTVREQFQVLTEAARGCDLIVGAGALQMAARSVAEALGIRYVFALYCPQTLPSPDHPPLKFGTPHSLSLPPIINRALWVKDEWRWNTLFRGAINEGRATLGLAPIRSAQPHVFTDNPWLATDPVLAPTPRTARLQIVQTGAWLLSDPTPLPDPLENFLTGGDPPIYFGFGSMRAGEGVEQLLLASARAVGRRAIVSKGWANLEMIDGADDCIAIGDVNHAKLFPRVAAVVHHGGAGTTTTAARAGQPQIIVPHMYDQFYWASRVRQLGVGESGFTPEGMTVAALAAALCECVRSDTTACAKTLASRIEAQGAQIAARRLVEEFG